MSGVHSVLSPVPKDLQQTLLACHTWRVLACGAKHSTAHQHTAQHAAQDAWQCGQCSSARAVQLNCHVLLTNTLCDPAVPTAVWKPPPPCGKAAPCKPPKKPLTVCRLLVEAIPLLLASTHITRHKVLQQQQQQQASNSTSLSYKARAKAYSRRWLASSCAKCSVRNHPAAMSTHNTLCTLLGSH